MNIQLNRRPDHDFTEPLGLLSDCHRRIEHFLRVLIAIDAGAAGGSLTQGDRAGLEAAIRYFAIAAPKHTADEEASLFPRLRTSGNTAAMQALEVLDRLESDHDAADRHHAVVERLVRSWLSENCLSHADRMELHDHLQRLQELYRRHIAIEDQELFPSASAILNREQLLEIGREMAVRRNVRLDGIAKDQSAL